MNTNFTIPELLILIGSLQGIVMGLLLVFAKKENKIANRWLAAILMAMSYSMLETIIPLDFPSLNIYLAPQIDFIFGPLLFFYVMALTQPEYSLKKRHFLHFLPLSFELIFYCALLPLTTYTTPISPDEIQISSSWRLYYFYEWAFSPTEQLLRPSILFCYILFCIRLLRKYQANLLDNFSNTEKLTLNWLKSLLVIYSILTFSWLSLSIVDVMVFKNEFDPHVYYPLYVAVACAIYIIGIAGYKQSQTILLEKQLDKPNPNPPLIKEDLSVPCQQVCFLIEEKKFFLDPELTLSSLADKLNFNPKYLSYILNSGLDKNFYDFVNEYRVEEVKRKLQDPRNDKFNLLGIAMDCGFNSKSTFNLAFKKYTGTTPQEFRAQKGVFSTST